MVSSVIHKLEKLVPFFIIKPGTCAVCVGAGEKELEKVAEGQRSPPEAERCCSGPQPGRPIIFCVLSPVAGEPWPWRPMSAVLLAATGSLGKPLGIKWEVGPSSL